MNFIEIPTITDRVTMILDGLLRAVAARIAPGIAGWAMSVVMIRLVWTRIRKAEGKLQGLLRRFQAGRLRVGGVTRSTGDGGRRGERLAPAAACPALGLPRRFGWLLPMVPFHAAGYASQLRYWLSDPEVVALLGVSAQARRILAPLCRMLAIESELLTPVAVAVDPSLDLPVPEAESPAVGRFGDPPVAAEGAALGLALGSAPLGRRRC